MNIDMMKLLEEFIKNAVIQGETTYSGDYKKGNKASDKLFEISKIMKENTELGKNMLDILLVNDETNVKIWACGIALDIGYKVAEAEKILKQLSEMPELGILGFNAKMTLDVRE